MQRRRFVQTLAAAVLTANAGVVAPQLWAQTVAQSAAAPLLEVFGKRPQSPARVFVAGPPAAMLVAALAPEALLGWPSRLSDDARAMLSPQLAALPTVGRLGGRGSSITTEALLALRPDVIVDVGTVDDYYRSQAQRTAAQTGIAYVLLDGRLPQTAQQLRELGALLGVVQRAELLAAYAEQSLQQAQSLRAQLQAQPPRVYLARSADGLETGWRGAINAELLEYVGAQNVASQQDAAASERASAGSVGRVSFEQVLAWNPDLIVTQEAGLAARIRSSNLWRSVAAVQTGQVLQSPHLPFGWIDAPPGVNRLIGLRWLTLALQHWGAVKPAQVALLDRASQAELEQEARAFYQLFYGMQGEAAWPEGALPWH